MQLPLPSVLLLELQLSATAADWLLMGMQAAMQGRWLVIEAIDLAPADVLSALVPLMEARQLQLPQRAQLVEAAPGFQLIATVTCGPGTPLLRLSQACSRASLLF